MKNKTENVVFFFAFGAAGIVAATVDSEVVKAAALIIAFGAYWFAVLNEKLCKIINHLEENEAQRWISKQNR